jgi:hypothetical protein
MKRPIKFLTGAIAATGSLALPFAVLAQDAFDQAGQYVRDVGGEAGIGAETPLPVIIGRIINIVLGFLGVLLLIYILYAGFLWMTAGGNEENVKKAKSMLKNAIIGLVIIVAAFAISTFVFDQLTQNVVN